MHKKYRKNQFLERALDSQGFSLMEVMIAGALASLIALTVAKVTQNANKSVMKVKTDIELLEFQNYLKGRLLDHVTCSNSDFGDADMTNGGTTSSFDPTGPADATTGYRAVTSMRIGPAGAKAWNLQNGQAIDGFPSWTMEEMRVYNIIELPVAGTNQGICTLYFRASRLGANGGKRSIGSRDKAAAIQLSCQLDPGTKEIHYCVNANSVTEGYWTLNNDSDTSEGINYPDSVTIGTRATPIAALSIVPESINSTEWFTGVRYAVELPVNASINLGTVASSYGVYSDDTCMRFRKTGATIDSISICDGYLGIGEAAPQRAIHITGDGAESDDVVLESNSNTSNAGLLTFWRSRGSSTAKQHVLADNLLGSFDARGWNGTSYVPSGGVEVRSASDYSSDESSYMSFRTKNSGILQEHIRLTANGNTGIGKTNPTEKLDINGNLAVSGTIALSSDRRFKKDIETIKRPLDKIRALRGVRYFMRKDEFPERDFNGKEHLGFIAQELEAIFPDLVKTANDGYKSVNYQGIIPLLVEGQKELELINKKQALKIQSLELQNQEILKELIEIKKLLKTKK